MPLECEIRAIELKKETALDDRLVFHLDGGSDVGEICLFIVVIFVFHCSGNDPGRRRGHERLDETGWVRFEGSAKIGNLRFQFCVVDVTHLANRFGRLVIAHRLPWAAAMVSASRARACRTGNWTSPADPGVSVFLKSGRGRHGRTPEQISACIRNIRGCADHTFPGEQFDAQSWPNNATRLSRKEWLWSAKRA